MPTVADVLDGYKQHLVNCDRNRGHDSCQEVVDKVVENIVEVERIVPPDMWFWVWCGLGAIAIVLILMGIRIIRPTHRYLLETLGSYRKTYNPGFHWIIPIIQKTVPVNITKQMVDIDSQVVITKDNLNARDDGVVYYKIIDPRSSVYDVDDHEEQLCSLASTTLRAVIGKMNLNEVNENREGINQKIEEALDKETKSYGVDVLMVELQSVDPPSDVQDSMNEMVKAEREKQAEKDRALQAEIKADGVRKAIIMKASGRREAAILEAEGKAKAFELVDKAFVGNAQLLKQLEVTQASMEKNSKIVIAEKGTNLQTIIGNIPTEGGK